MFRYGKSERVDWLFLDMNSFFASVEQQVQPALRGKPVAVIPTDTDATCAIAASYEAKAYGIKTGTPIWEAKKLCPELICTLANHEAYVEMHHRFLKVIDQTLPVEKVCSIDEVACTLMGPQKHLDEALRLAHKIKADFRAQLGEYIRCSIGLSSNRLLAKIATDMHKPDAITVLTPDAMPEALADAPLTDLPGIGRNMDRRLKRAGIFSIPQLYHLPPKQARAIWHGVQGERFWHALHGEELPEFETQKRVVGHSHVLAPSWRPADQAITVARRLTSKAASRLRRYDLYATRMYLSFRDEESGARYAMEVVFDAADDTPTLTAAMQSMWVQMMLQSRTRRVKKISVTLHGLRADPFAQGNLFEAENPAISKRREKLRNMSFAMDKLNARFGRDTVTLGTTPSHALEFSGTKIAFDRIPDLKEFHE